MIGAEDHVGCCLREKVEPPQPEISILEAVADTFNRE